MKKREIDRQTKRQTKTGTGTKAEIDTETEAKKVYYLKFRPTT